MFFVGLTCKRRPKWGTDGCPSSREPMIVLQSSVHIANATAGEIFDFLTHPSDALYKSGGRERICGFTCWTTPRRRHRRGSTWTSESATGA
jgi:hypothetical protein